VYKYKCSYKMCFVLSMTDYVVPNFIVFEYNGSFLEYACIYFIRNWKQQKSVNMWCNNFPSRFSSDIMIYFCALLNWKAYFNTYLWIKKTAPGAIHLWIKKCHERDTSWEYYFHILQPLGNIKCERTAHKRCDYSEWLK